jgi:type II secretory ATPase GspE/PulE/Tfp pilus assembly ATPase PilB-like protein
MNAPADTQIRIREAEEYYRHGLYTEASQLYERLLSEASLDPETADSIAERIREIDKKIKEMESIDRQVLSSRDLDCIRSTWGKQEKPSDILQSGKAFGELGLHKEALGEFIKLLSKDYPLQESVRWILDSLCAAHPGGRMLEPLQTALKEAEVEAKLGLDLIFACGKELCKRQMTEVAEAFFNVVKEDNPRYPGLAAELARFGSSQRYDSRYAFLLENKLVNTEQLQQALAMAKKSGKSVEAVLQEEFRIPKTQIAESLRLFYNVNFKAFDPKTPVPIELIQKLKKSFLFENKWVPLAWDLNAVDVLIDDPKNIIKTDQAQALLKASHLSLFVGFREDIEAYIHLFYKENHDEVDAEQSEDAVEGFDMLPDVAFEEVEEETDSRLHDHDDAGSSHTVRMVDQILINAYRKGASDIHIEPSPISKKTRIRYRIDGVCQEVLQLPNQAAKPLISRIKVMARLDIAERRMPQDGKIKFRRKGIRPFELRVATLPTAGGFEDAVLRILAESGAMPLGRMGMSDRNLTHLKKIIRQPYGLILVVGPTGSGKTTTLHAALGEINKPGIKIWTAEDPVEISQEGLRQVECQSKIGLDFARVMRAFLRADPDVIMIGEMRDHETAAIGIEASLTGHLVFSTLHTNSAPETVTRLLDMGLNPLNFSDAFLGVMAQRLVRRLCDHCKEKYHPTPEMFEEIRMLYGEGMEKAGLVYDEHLYLYKKMGCPECSNTGYKGRLGIHELLLGTPKVKLLIKRAAPTEELFIQGAADGMTTLIQDGIAKVFQGMTDFEEVRRVCAS